MGKRDKSLALKLKIRKAPKAEMVKGKGRKGKPKNLWVATPSARNDVLISKSFRASTINIIPT